MGASATSCECFEKSVRSNEIEIKNYDKSSKELQEKDQIAFSKNNAINIQNTKETNNETNAFSTRNLPSVMTNKEALLESNRELERNNQMISDKGLGKIQLKICNGLSKDITNANNDYNSPRSLNKNKFKNSKDIQGNSKYKDKYTNKNLLKLENNKLLKSPLSSQHKHKKDIKIINYKSSRNPDSLCSSSNTPLSISGNIDNKMKIDTEESKEKYQVIMTNLPKTSSQHFVQGMSNLKMEKKELIKGSFDKDSIVLGGEKIGKIESLSKIPEFNNIYQMHEDSNIREDSLFNKNMMTNQSENPINFSENHRDALQRSTDKIKKESDQSLAFHSELMKYSSPSGHQAAHFQKYCTLTSTEFRYYKSQESYFRLSNPLFKVALANIIDCSVLKGDKVLKAKKFDYHYFCIKLDEKCEKDRYIRDLFGSGVNTEIIINHDNSTNRKNKHSETDRKQDKKPKTISLLEEKKENSIINNKIKSTQTYGIDNNSHIFASNSEEVVLTWVKTINFLIKSKK